MCCYPRFGFILFLYIRNYKIFEMNHWTYFAVRMSWFVSLTGLCILSHQERIINLGWYFVMMNWMFLMKVIPESLCALNCISTFLLLSLSRHICWWTIRPRVYHPPVISASALTWFVIYIVIEIHVIIIKVKVLIS